MLYDKKLPSLKDKIIEKAEQLEQETDERKKGKSKGRLKNIKKVKSYEKKK